MSSFQKSSACSCVILPCLTCYKTQLFGSHRVRTWYPQGGRSTYNPGLHISSPLRSYICPGKEIGHLPSPARQFIPWQPDVTLALVGPIVHRHQQPIPTRALPGKGQEAIPGPVAFPGGSTFEQLPLAIAHDRLAENGKQPVVKLL